MLYIVGLGLADETDITVKGLDIVKRASEVYLEAYTAVLSVGKEQLVCQPLQILFHLMILLLTRCDATVGNVLWPTGYRRRPRNGRV